MPQATFQATSHLDFHRPSTLSPTLPLFLLLCLCASMTFAQSGVLQSGRVSDVQLAVWEIPSKNELHRVDRGGAFTMVAGDQVMLRVFSPRGSNASGERKYLSARFRIAEGGKLGELRDADTRKGSATLKTYPRAGGERLVISYELTGNYTAAGMMRGSFIVRPQRAPGAGGSGSTGDGGGPSTVPPGAEGDVYRLYRGILLRDPNDGARDFIRSVERDGYPALVAVARQVAESRESQSTLRQRGVSDTERLEALYKELLGRGRDRVDQREWRSQMGRLADGRIVDVVMDIVQSAAFRNRYDR